jgi:hypothetical protein
MQTRQFASVALLLLGHGVAQARHIGYIPTTEQLETPATLVCIGEVLSTASSGPDLISVYTGGVLQGYPETWMSARVKVLHVFKGAAPAEIIFRYRAPQPQALLEDSPIHVRLIGGNRYYFFLKPGLKAGEFIGVLDGRIDDGFGVQTLCPEESNDSPPMSDAEVVRIALDYLHRKRPGVRFDLSLASVWPEPGGIEDDVTVATSNNAGAEQAKVAVFRDRTIDETDSRLDERR